MVGITPQNAAITDVVVVFKTHLDVGFTDFARLVRAEYLDHYLPKAVRLAEAIRLRGASERFVWTTGSWLIAEYLDHAPLAGRQQMEDAILAGDIAWHALPFTWHSELLDPDLYRGGLGISRELDQRFGRQTRAAKMTDVPGNTIGVVPLLAEAGVQFLHMGVNPSVIPPEVPPLFVWRAPTGEEIIVAYHLDYGGSLIPPGSTIALAISMTGDNQGPPSLDLIDATFRTLHAQYPNARITGGTLDQIIPALLACRADLPVITAEIGDTWIHGIGSDPYKVSQFRALARLRSHWLVQGRMTADDARMQGMSRSLLLVAEHTWGMDEKKYLADEERYHPNDLALVRHTPQFAQFEASWAEQREYIDQAVEALGKSELAEEARRELAEGQPRRPHLADWQPLSTTRVTTPHFVLTLDPIRGTVVGLREQRTQRNWAGPAHPWGWVRYQTFTTADYERFARHYVRPEMQDEWWVRQDLGKPGIEHLDLVSQMWDPIETHWYQQQTATGVGLLAHLLMPSAAMTAYGCPRDLFVQWQFPHADPTCVIEVLWFDQPASRLPQALWLTIVPLGVSPTSWQFEKLGQWIDPLGVLAGGNRHLHAVGQGVRCGNAGEQVELKPLDTPLVAPGHPSLLHFTKAQPDLAHGVSFNLYNNIYGTNFRMWYDDDTRCRFHCSWQATTASESSTTRATFP